MAYVKLDTGILDSTLWINRDIREIFITALLMAEPKEFHEPVGQLRVNSIESTGWAAPPGWYGYVPAAGAGIVRRAGIEQDEGLAALDVLCSPDPESRSPEFEGRRMIRIENGYLILNYMKYRDKDHSAAERQRRLRYRRKLQANSATVTSDNNTITALPENDSSMSRATSRIADADADADKEKRESARASKFPEGWSMSGDMRLIASALGINPETTWEKFKAHYTAAGSQRHDWKAAWKLWCHREREMGGNGGSIPVRDPWTALEQRAQAMGYPKKPVKTVETPMVYKTALDTWERLPPKFREDGTT
jgi:hypothetical protein